MGHKQSKISLEHLPNTNISDKYHITSSKLSENDQSKIFLAVELQQKKDVVVKIMPKINDEKHNNFIKRECEICMRLNHKHIVKFLDYYFIDNTHYLISEYCSLGDLFSFIDKKTFIDLKETKKLFAQIISAVEYLHVNFIAHRDIKPHNILVDGDGNIKLADFGFSIIVNEDKRKTQCGSFGYFAPEVITKDSYHPLLTEVWSLGIVLFFMTTGELPYDPEIYDSIIINKNFTINFREYEIDDNNLIQLIREMLVPDINMRLNLIQVKKRLSTMTNIIDNHYGVVKSIDVEKVKKIANMGYNKEEILKAIFESCNDDTSIYIGMYNTLHKIDNLSPIQPKGRLTPSMRSSSLPSFADIKKEFIPKSPKN